jgi:Na+-transporting methylmalonyl-CoA/oxaloacetate decarboxylase gamma subunit
MTAVLIVLGVIAAFVAAMAYRTFRVVPQARAVPKAAPRSVTLKAAEPRQQDDAVLDQPA